MTDNQKERVKQLRNRGVGYTKIAQEIGVSENTIKSFCRRNNLTAVKREEPIKSSSCCEFCKKRIIQVQGRKHKRFCSDKCRNKWWNEHLNLVNRKAVYKCKCKNCGKWFEVYGNNHRKYCSHKCYIEYRFGGGNDEQ